LGSRCHTEVLKDNSLEQIINSDPRPDRSTPASG